MNTTKRESTWHEETGEGGCIYRIRDDGRVIAYGREPEPPTPGLWRATEWTKNPSEHDDAQYVHVLADGTWAALQATLTEWEGKN